MSMTSLDYSTRTNETTSMTNKRYAIQTSECDTRVILLTCNSRTSFNLTDMYNNMVYDRRISHHVQWLEIPSCFIDGKLLKASE
jgi:hypothetical protein